ncbi:M-phase phosphoprotein 8 isoform X2 [Cololabis saira]|uniref:M-phase phosphoprotein 8 isoform X2 n=1 Tax=Cololabis saira TaxID=129043 RepID=UPI002AD2A5D0|nr:M-phase phosphoprotein 8 isoform X2 [Cololabis saira]
MASEPAKDPAESEEEDVYEVERIIDMRVEEGEVLYRVRWKNYCSDDDTWEPEAHLEDCREVLLTFKKHLADAETKKVVPLPTKSDLFDADSESDSDKDRPTDAPIKKKKKKKLQEEKEEDPSLKEKKKKKKDKHKEEPRPLPAPETDEEEERPPTPTLPPKEKKTESKKRGLDSDDEDDESGHVKKHKKEKGKEGGKHRKDKGEEGKKKKAKKERKIESSEDEAPALAEGDLSEGPSESQMEDSAPTDTLTKSAEKPGIDDKFKQKRGKWEVKLQGIKDLIHDKKSKKADATQKESSLPKVKSSTSKNKEDTALQSDSSDSSTLHKKPKSKGNESTPAATQKVPSSSTSSSSSSSSVTAVNTAKLKEEEVTKEEVLAPKDASGSTNLFEKFLLNCEAKDRAPRRPQVHQLVTEKSSSKSAKLIGKIEKIPKTAKDSPAQKAEPEKTERTKQSDAARSGYGFSLDSDEREEESTGKSKPADESRERKEKPEEPQRPAWERRSSTDDRRKRREDSEPRLFMACDDTQDPAEGAEKLDKGQATLSLGMDLNLDWMTLDDFQKHLNGEDEILSGPPLSPSELRDAVKSGDYMAVKLALNSKEDYNLEQEECTIGERRSFEGERSLIEERSSSGSLSFTSNIDCARSENATPNAKGKIPQDLDGPENYNEIPICSASTNTVQQTLSDHENTHGVEGNKTKSIKEAYNSSNILESQEKEDVNLTEEKIMLDDINAALSTKMSLNIDNSDPTREEEEMTKLDDKVKQKDMLPNNLDGKDQGLSETDPEVMAKRGLRQRGRTIDYGQPTRSSLRSCKKVIETNTGNADTEKKDSVKKHFCLFCKLAFTQLAKHLEKKHAEETDVAHAIHFPKGSKVRQALLDDIRNKGDYEHNCQVLKSGEGEIVTKKQMKNPTISVRDFLPCQHCFAFYRKTDLWRHEHSCKVRKGDQKAAEKMRKTRSQITALHLLPMSEFLTGTCKEIIHIMHQDEISRHIRIDPLICKYGNALSTKYDDDKSQFNYIAQKMRELGRFVLAVNEIDSSVKYLHEICLPSKFELAIQGVKKMSGFDPSSSKFKTISLVSKIGYSLKRAAEIAFGESRMTEDSETESELKKFIQLLDTKWTESFSRKSLVQSLKHEVKKEEVDQSTVTEDLMKLHRFITGEEDDARRELNENPSISTWKKLSEATLADVCLFNRGRVGNIGRLLLQTYTQRKNRGTFMPSVDQVKKSTKLELEVGSSFTQLELEGQSGRNMLVLLTNRMVSSIDLLVEHREQAGVSKTNPYLFARTEGPSFIRGLDCFRRAAVECGVKNPEALLSSSLREQIASCWQLMSLCERELDEVAKMMGRSSQECYTLTQNAYLLDEVSKQLLKMERALPQSPPSTAKQGTGQKPALKRKPWSESEQAAVKRYLSEFITRMKVPGKKECNACIAAEPDLGGRSWTDVKNYVHNTLQTVRRRNNQQNPERGENILNPKRSKPAVETTKTNLEETSDVCTMTTVNPDHLRESLNCCMTVPPPTHLRESSPFSQDIAASYGSLCSTSTNMVLPSQELISTFTPLNATDTQVVPTFTPHNTTNALMPPVYTSENHQTLTLSSLYTQNATNMLPPPLYTTQDTSGSAIIPSFSTFNAPSTSMIPTYTQLNTTSAPIASAFSTLNDRCRPVMSSFTPLNHSTPAPYPTSPPTNAQVVPSFHGHGVSERAPVLQDSTLSPAGGHVTQGVKPQKRNKRLWSEEEQQAVRRYFGDFCKLVKVPGKKDCDACLAAEPALNTRTWREVKYFVHNSIQSLKRRGHAVTSKQSRPQEPEIQTPSTEWDGPVYLSL